MPMRQTSKPYKRVETRSSKPANVPESRRFRRVRVNLKGALRIPGHGVEIVRTKNISEGGVAVSLLSSPSVTIGTDVQLHLSGIVSNETDDHSTDSKRLETFTMRVVHAENKSLGLCFV